MTIKYAMRSEGRARPVAKDIIKLAAEFGLEIKLSAAQETAARLFGYRNWQDMVASKTDTAQGPEDHELAHDDLIIRLAAQKAALIEVGFPSEAGDDIVRRLRATGRSDAAFEALPRFGRLQDDHRYHIDRLNRALLMVDDLVGVPQSAESLTFFADFLREWAEHRSLLHLDEITIEEPELLEMVIEMTSDFCNECVVIDASAEATDLARLPVPNDLTDTIAFGSEHLYDMTEWDRDKITQYVHFGDGLFDSPYEGAGVEGAYVTFKFNFAIDERPDFIEFALVVADRSPEVADPGMALRNTLRMHYFNFSFDEERWLADELKELQEPALDPDSLDGVWKPYVMAPLTAALHAIHRYHAPATRRDYALSKGWDPRSARKLERTVGFDEFRVALYECPSRTIACFLDGKPSRVPDPTRVIAGPIRGTDSKYDSVWEQEFEAMVEDGRWMRDPQGYLLAARKAMEIAAELARTDQADFTVEARTNLVGAALLCGDVELASEQARWFRDTFIDYSDIRAEFRPLVAATLIVEGDTKLADAILHFPSDAISNGSYRVAMEVLAGAEGLETPAERMGLLQYDRRAEYLVGDGQIMEFGYAEASRL
jgi:hypothetical protein